MTKILIIEDNNDIRENVVEILNLSGYQVFEANTGQMGIALATAHLPEVILCDIMMPGTDGYGVFEALHSQEQTRHIPFIFITAKSERTDVRKGMDMGADDYLTKPFDASELLSAVETRLRKKQLQQDFYSKSIENITALFSGKEGVDVLKAALGQRKINTFKRKQVIYHEGDRVNGIWLVLSGKVKTTKLTEDGREFINGIFETDHFVATNTLFAEGVYLDSATAMEDAQLVLFPNSQFEELINLYPDVAGKFIRILSNQIRDKEEHLMQLAYHSVRKRVAEGLLKFYRQRTNKDNSLKVSRNDLAAFTGTAQETVSRALTDLCEEGLIEKQGSTLLVLDEKKLERLRN